MSNLINAVKPKKSITENGKIWEIWRGKKKKPRK